MNGGLEHFDLFKQFNPDTKLDVNGHVLRNDYEVNLALDQSGLGFIHSGWQQYRKYYNDVGGYDPNLDPSAPSLNQNLYLDIGKAWVDFGLTVPNWPRMVLGYEYDYRQGNEATLEWNSVGTNAATARNIGPATENIDETVHVIKFNLDYDHKGFTASDEFRGEFYHLSTGSTNVGAGPLAYSVSNKTSYFQGQNTLRLEKKFNEWLYASAGYLYSKLNADSASEVGFPSVLVTVTQPDITLEKESNVGNVNALLGPIAGFTLSAGVLADFSTQTGLGSGVQEQQFFMPATNIFTPFAVNSDYDETDIRETAALHYSKIPFTSLFAEAWLEQDDISQFDQFSSQQFIINTVDFTQHTMFTSRSSEARVGFDTSPWRFISLTAYYRYADNNSEYDSSPLVLPQNIPIAYPTFITSRDLKTDEFDAKMVLHFSPLFKTTLSYQYEDTDYDVTTRPFTAPGNQIITPGGELQAGTEHGQTVSITGTLTPISRLFLDASLSYEDSTLTTAANGSPSVVPYNGYTATVLADATYAISTNSSLTVAYFFSDANYGQDNFSSGLPLGIQYQRHSAQISLSRKLGKKVSARLQYRFDYYNEPSSGGANNYTANSIFGSLSFQFR